MSAYSFGKKEGIKIGASQKCSTSQQNILRYIYIYIVFFLVVQGVQVVGLFSLFTFLLSPHSLIPTGNNVQNCIFCSLAKMEPGVS
jgi:hypothetical protein